MTNLLLASAMLITLGTTLLLSFTHSERKLDERMFRSIWGAGAFFVTMFMLLVIITHSVVMMKQGKFSASPFMAFEIGSREGGFFDGLYLFVQTSIFLAWSFFLPAHLYANHNLDLERGRPLYPYLINFLIGVILCAENSLLHDFFGRLMR